LSNGLHSSDFKNLVHPIFVYGCVEKMSRRSKRSTCIQCWDLQFVPRILWNHDSLPNLLCMRLDTLHSFQHLSKRFSLYLYIF
jgi:hypothetical protein